VVNGISQVAPKLNAQSMGRCFVEAKMAVQPADTPAYEGLRYQVTDQELLCLILDKTSIYLEDEPWRPLFELSISPREARAQLFGIGHVRHGVSASDGEGECLYTMTTFTTSSEQPIAVGTSDFQGYKFVILRARNWLSCHAVGHFKTRQNVKQKLK
jgi:hypothetical protein